MNSKTIKKFLPAAALFVGAMSYGQVGIGTATPNASAMLDIESTNKGLLIPRVALGGTADVATVSTPVESMMVFNTATAGDVTPGYYYYSAASTKWEKLAVEKGLDVKSKDLDYPIVAGDAVIVSTAIADQIITLPAASAANKGKQYTVKKSLNNSAKVTVKSAGGTIDGVAAATGISGSVYLQGWVFQSDGTNWWIISRI